MIESFRDLYFEVIAKGAAVGEALADYLTWASLDGARELMDPLQPHRHRNSEQYPYSVEPVDLWDWYALSRVNDVLLLAFQPPPAWDVEHDPSDYHEYLSNVAPGKSLPHDVPALSGDVYLKFFEALGFEAFWGEAFSPFHHEVVDVRIADRAGPCPGVDHVYWPGLKFGEMVFSRAGVRVTCSPSALVPATAERSTLYFAHVRRRRRTEDLSVGWGHNSQWRTEFRRDYEDDEHLYFNVDGAIDLGAELVPGQLGTEIDPHPAEDLPLDVRRELLIHRCLVRSPLPDGDLWPYDDTLTVDKSSDVAL